MKEYRDGQISVISRPSVYNEICRTFSREDVRNALRFHRSIPAYRRTPLVSLECAAREHRVGSILVKDESSRFGLKAFKGLGGSYSMFRILCEKLSLDPFTADYSTFQDERIKAWCADRVFVTTTDGNHGKGVSWAAGLFGCQAHVFMPKGTVEARRRAVEEAGSATAEITDMDYDRTVRYTAALAEEKGWILIQDTVWEGYEQIPKWIMDGYLTLAAETAEQMNEKRPSHLFLQAGVGSMAGAIEAYYMNRFRENMPLVTIVEAEAAACIYQSAGAGDGEAHSVPGSAQTIMAGLNCETPCRTIWPVLRDCSVCFCACRDSVSEAGMRAYASPSGTDPAVVSGESGAVTYGLLLYILQSDELRKLFRIREDSVILLINTEGDTDPQGYLRVTGREKQNGGMDRFITETEEI